MNSPDEKPDEPRQVVRRSSPLGRRKKPKAAAPAAQDAVPEKEDAEKEDVETSDAEKQDVVDEQDVADSDPAVADSDPAVADSEAEPSAVESDPDEASQSAAYRERRRERVVVRRAATGREAGDRSRLTTVAVVLTVLVLVAGVVLSAVFGVQYYNIRKDRELRTEYSSFAQQMVVSMFTLNPENADQMYKNVMDNSSGRARQMFKDNMKNTAKMIREGDMSTKTTVIADAVSKATDDEGSVLVVLDWEGHPRKDPKATQAESFRLRVDITRINGALKMTYLDWVA